MSLFGKKKETEKAVCDCACGTSGKEPEPVKNTCCSGSETGICCIRVLGLGCRSCHAMLENTQKAVRDMGLDIEVEYITDMQKISAYGAMSMPALVVNEKVVGMGKVYKPEEIVALLHKLGY